MKKITSILAAVAIIAVSAFTTEGGYKVGDKVADFKLKNIDDKMVSMADYKDAKGIIVVFTCNHCPFAKKYESRIMDLDKKYKSKGFPVVAISPNDPSLVAEDSFENMQKLAKEKGLLVPQIALAFVLHQPMDIYALISCDGREQFVSNCAVFDIHLTPGELAYLDLLADTP